ncbi:MAG TPA: hypothetical protein VNR87_03220 [Flavisolibacter sp.]|nr:hypothetical protein [Flavisolibacter sp.]
MEKDKKNKSGSSSSKSDKNESSADRGRTDLPGSPAKSNRQTGGNDRHERDDSSRGAEKNTTKKGGNSV